MQTVHKHLLLHYLRRMRRLFGLRKNSGNIVCTARKEDHNPGALQYVLRNIACAFSFGFRIIKLQRSAILVLTLLWQLWFIPAGVTTRRIFIGLAIVYTSALTRVPIVIGVISKQIIGTIFFLLRGTIILLLCRITLRAITAFVGCFCLLRLPHNFRALR